MILADTGFFVALGNRNDTFHSKAQQQLNILKVPADLEDLLRTLVKILA